MCAVPLRLRHGLLLPEVWLIKSFDFPFLQNIALKTHAKDDISIFSMRCQSCSFQFFVLGAVPSEPSKEKENESPSWVLPPSQNFPRFCLSSYLKAKQILQMIFLQHNASSFRLSKLFSHHKVNTTRAMLMTITSILNFEPQNGN